MNESETQVRIGIRVEGKDVVVDADPAFLRQGYSVVWYADLAPNEEIEIRFKEECPFRFREGHPNNPNPGQYRRYNTGSIVTGRAIGRGDFHYGVFYRAYDRDWTVVREACIDPMIKI